MSILDTFKKIVTNYCTTSYLFHFTPFDVGTVKQYINIQNNPSTILMKHTKPLRFLLIFPSSILIIMFSCLQIHSSKYIKEQ